jgi:hypothetical protein
VTTDLVIDGARVRARRITEADWVERTVGKFTVEDAWVAEDAAAGIQVEFSVATDPTMRHRALFLVRQRDEQLAEMMCRAELSPRAASRLLVVARLNTGALVDRVPLFNRSLALLAARGVVPIPLETAEDRLLWLQTAKVLAHLKVGLVDEPASGLA